MSDASLLADTDADLAEASEDLFMPDEQQELVLHHPRRMIVQYALREDGTQELRLYYDDKEISFDEPELFVFGETLSRQSRFRALDAVQWGDGLTWPRVQLLLGQLVEAGVLAPSDGEHADLSSGSQAGAMPSPLPPGPCPSPRSWHEGSALMADLTGQPLELGYLEVVVPVFRVIHMLMDSEGRQVGEANVFPTAMRQDIDTRWRRCIYSGSRYLAEQPMNVSALKSIRAQWGQIMQLLLAVRAGYVRRFPAVLEHGWTVGHVERLSTVVLALPTYLMMRQANRVENGALHPALASLFRVTDGLRLTMHQMLFVPVGEPTRQASDPVNSADILDYAERNYAFHSPHGVCAGPLNMIAEFLQGVLDGQSPKDGGPEVLDPGVQQALEALEPALDYGFSSLRVHGIAFSLWTIMTAAYEQMLSVMTPWSETLPQGSAALQWYERVQQHVEHMRSSTYLGSQDWRESRDRVYEDMVQHCEIALGLPPGEPLTQRLSRRPRDSALVQVQAQVQGHLAARLGVPVSDRTLEGLSEVLMDFVQQAQRVVRHTSTAQQLVNEILEREQPQQALSASDIDLHNRLQNAPGAAASSAPASVTRKLPFLLDELAQALGLRLHIGAEHVHIQVQVD